MELSFVEKFEMVEVLFVLDEMKLVEEVIFFVIEVVKDVVEVEFVEEK